uniref:PCIF1 WW domain-containing protein n=1 Tax=Eucampia antarctica TaxID=49252 RepID=A0A6U0SUF3_9STRA|mmetsp:Transcript_27449/g.26310  ORF Transcript_27449/g.26310 Transcript_27449/m.26310 type:complete len:351 (+) Transcript_27449:936-1988(+)
MLLQDKEGTSALAVPDDELAEVLASKFVRDLEQISVEVRKTQSALVRIGGEDYLKSVEDKMLGMRLSEVTTKYYDEEGDTVEKTIMRIEWHTKSSIAQGRPPQVQKIYKTHFDMLSKYYREYSSGTDPELKHMLTRTFVLLCRYDLIGDMKNGCNTSLPPQAFETLTKHFGVTHECFASPMNHACPSYNSIFPDIDRYFGSLGSFFDFVPKEGSFELDIPFNSASAKMILDHILGLLYQSDSDKHPLSFIIIVPHGDDFLEYAQNSPFLRKTATVEVDTANAGLNFMSEMQYKDTGSSSRKVSRNADDADSSDGYGFKLILWLQNDFGHDLWTPVDEKVQAVVDCFDTSI